MDTTIADELTKKYPLGKLLAEGKTKTIYQVTNDPHLAILVSKDDITAGDGKKHDVIPGKGRLANETTCNVFRLLKECGLPVAFREQDSVNSFVAEKCSMLPYEVVARREAHGSYLKRNPHLEKGHLFPQLLVEFFLKTKDRHWGHYVLPCDDPLMIHDRQAAQILLFSPTEPIYAQKPFLKLHEMEVFRHEEEWKHFRNMEHITRQAFLIIEKAWQILGRTLVDFKVEFGINATGKLLLADVIDNDSWRILEHGAHIDKQIYRDGGTLDAVVAAYERVTEMTRHFQIPQQQIILWRGSEKDTTEAFVAALGTFVNLLTIVTCSTHKEPERAADIFPQLIHAVPDSVVIAYIGKSNGAGPTLSALSTIPVITVPARIKEFRGNIWSSLETLRGAPVMTVLEPENAVLAALQILSARNPRIYAHLREDIEKRRRNSASL